MPILWDVTLTGDAVQILASVLLFVVASLLGLIAWIFLDFRRQVTKQIAINGRHLDSIITQIWVMTYRVDNVETFLEDRIGYKPARVPQPEVYRPPGAT